MRRCILILSLLLSVAMLSWGQESDSIVTSVQDTVQNLSRMQRARERFRQRIEDKRNEPYDTTRDSGYWWRALKHGHVNFKDSTMGYPKFVMFCYRTYIWGDRVFNSYDSTYVVGTGKNWKLFLKNDNWLDSYIGHTNDGMDMITNSNLVSNVGVTLAFMAVSVGYSLGVSNLIHGGKISDKLDFSFTCARFAADAFYWKNNNEVTATYTMKNNEKHKTRQSGIRRKAMGLTAYYFFNNRRYAQAAAYCFSKYQRRSAGSWLAGFSLQHYDVKMDVEQMSEDIRPAYPTQADAPRILYNDYCLLIGYGHNWVLSRKWLLNVTITPYIGYRYNHFRIDGNRPDALSLNCRARIGAVYNHKKYFLAFQSSGDHHRYTSHSLRLVSSLIDFSILGGIRF